MLGVPDVGEVRVVRVQQRGDGELVLRQQRRVLVGVQRRRQRRVDLCQSYPSSIHIDRQISHLLRRQNDLYYEVPSDQMHASMVDRYRIRTDLGIP